MRTTTDQPPTTVLRCSLSCGRKRWQARAQSTENPLRTESVGGAKLADENGWKVLHEFFFNGNRLNTIYRISSTPDAVTAHIRRRETPPPDEGINIDMKALEKHMRDLMPPSYRVKNSRHRFPTPTSQQELQEIVLAMLAEDNGWQVAVEDRSISNNKIYRIK